MKERATIKTNAIPRLSRNTFLGLCAEFAFGFIVFPYEDIVRLMEDLIGDTEDLKER